MQTRNTKLIIFSDLDGSLLDHETYHKKKFMIPPSFCIFTTFFFRKALR